MIAFKVIRAWMSLPLEGSNIFEKKEGACEKERKKKHMDDYCDDGDHGHSLCIRHKAFNIITHSVLITIGIRYLVIISPFHR